MKVSKKQEEGNQIEMVMEKKARQAEKEKYGTHIEK